MFLGGGSSEIKSHSLWSARPHKTPAPQRGPYSPNVGEEVFSEVQPTKGRAKALRPRPSLKR